MGAISILTAKGKPDKVAHDVLSRCARILVALDADEDKVDGGNPGADAWVWWKQTYPQAKLWPVSEGKDPGEAFTLGINLADWIFAGTPLLIFRAGKKARGLPLKRRLRINCASLSYPGLIFWNMKMSNLAIVQLPLASLRPYAHNPRKNDAAVPRMVEALREFGFRVPILAKSDGEIIDGHLRYKAALAIGLAEVPVILADDMSEAQIRAFRIMINRSATWA